MAASFDLLGDPIPANWGKRGRPAHIPTQQNSNRIILLLAMKWSDERIAQALGITDKTLRKHYFRQLRFRDEARPRVQARVIEALYDKVRGGSVAAIKELQRMIDRADLEDAGATYLERQSRTQTARAPALGKKEQRIAAASEVAGMYAPGAPPSAVSH